MTATGLVSSAQLDEFSQKGWKLISIIPLNGIFNYYFGETTTEFISREHKIIKGDSLISKQQLDEFSEQGWKIFFMLPISIELIYCFFEK